MSSGALPAGAQVAPAADSGNRRRQCHGGLGLRPGCAALRGGRWSLLSTATAASGAVGRSSSPSAESGGVAGRCGGPLEKQQHRRPQAESEAAPGGLGARQARVRPMVRLGRQKFDGDEGRLDDGYDHRDRKALCYFDRVAIRSCVEEGSKVD